MPFYRTVRQRLSLSLLMLNVLNELVINRKVLFTICESHRGKVGATLLIRDYERSTFVALQVIMVAAWNVRHAPLCQLGRPRD